MKKFIVMYHATPEATKQMAAATPKQQAKGMEGWMKWAQKSGDQIVDLGNPLINGVLISRDGTSKKSRKGAQKNYAQCACWRRARQSNI
jgi:hypothetical protein